MTTRPTFRDLNHNGRLDPYEDPSQPVEQRVTDLLGRLSLEEKVGLMFHTVIEAGTDGHVLAGPGAIAKTGTREVVVGKRMNHFNVHALTDARVAARWHNNVQQVALDTPHGIPVTISSDPRHSSALNFGTSWITPFFSQWPDPLGLAALRDPDLVRGFADTVRREYAAVGIRAALHPTADLATEPRWGRQRETFGQDPDLVSQLVGAYVAGLQGATLGAASVAATTKHFPGGGPQADGEDAHFPYGRDQVYPGGRFDDHLAPFRVALAEGTSAIMPYYGRPIGLVVGGEPIEEVGFGYNQQLLTGLLRRQLGFDGIILSDWELVNDNLVGDKVLPARAWGVEHLDPAGRLELLLRAGIDQFGGEECTDMLVELVSSGVVLETRIDESARRLLRQKFHLGLFDDPFVDEDAAAVLPDHADVARGRAAQARSACLLTNDGILPLTGRRRVYVEGLDPQEAARLGEVVERPEDAEVAVIRLQAPWESRDDLFLEAMFHQGSLDFPPGLPVRLARIAQHCPVVIDVNLDRAAVLTPLVGIAAALTGSFGVGHAAYVDVLTGAVPPAGRLPVQLPRSMDAVRASREDVPGDTPDPLFEFGHGLSY